MKTVWIVSSQQWPRIYMVAELLERGFRTAVFENSEDFLAAFLAIYGRKPDVILLELTDLSITNELLAALEESRVPVIALGSETSLSREITKDFKWAGIIRRPYTIGTAVDMVEALLGGCPRTGIVAREVKDDPKYSRI